MAKNIYKVSSCDYCGTENQIVRPTPFMADVPAMMCKICWDDTKEEYMNSNGEWIPKFEDGPGYEEMESIEIINTVPSSMNPNYRMHMLAKYECLDCENSFILSKKQADEANEITCPYCRTDKIEEVALMVDSDSLEEMGCMGIHHMEEGESNE